MSVRFKSNTFLKIGDVVRLTSGGPSMTVGFIYSDEHPVGAIGVKNDQVVQCIWFNEHNDLKVDNFHVEQLVSN